MKFDLKSPCPHCPFRTDIEPYLRRARAESIVCGLEQGTFSCHEAVGTSSEQHCAGALIMLEHAEAPGQMMRVAERLGIYDRKQLDMDAPVFDSPVRWVAAQERG